MTIADRMNKSDEPKEPKAKRSASMPKLKKSKGPVADVAAGDEYGNARSMSASDAHRDVVYEPPSMVSQMMTVFMVQMKRFFRDRAFWFLIVLILIVPIGVFLMEPLELVESDISNTFMAAALTLAPVMCSLVAAICCGSMVPQEFNERTAFMSMPLPMSRMSFCLGKFLAGLSLSLAVVLAVYGLAVISSAAVADVTYPGSIGASIGVAITTMFCYCCITFLVSVFMKRSGTMVALLLLAGVLPAIVVGIGFVIPADALGYLPFFGFDLSVMMLGTPPLGVVASVLGFLGSMAPFGVGSNAGIMAATGIILGIICLALAIVKVQRRDM